MANEEHLVTIRQGTSIWNTWRQNNSRIKPDLSGADLSGMDLIDANLSYTDFTRADLSDANLLSVNLHKANLNGANLYDVNLSGADLSDANLNGSDLTGGNLSDANLRRAALSGAYVNRANLFEAHLNEANLNGAEFVGTDFIGTDVSRANLSKANFFDALFNKTDLSEANLSEANLYKADFFDTDLSNADLSGANLIRANLRNTNLMNACVRNTYIGWTVFARVNMIGIDGLVEVIHRGPSTIGIDTIKKSGGNIPGLFLRRCGMLPWEIELTQLYDMTLAPSDVEDIGARLLQKRIEDSHFTRGIFISFCNSDSEFAEKLHKYFDDAGTSVWMDSHDISHASTIEGTAINVRVNDVIVLVLSKNSVSTSWIENELEITRRRSKILKRELLVPVALDNSWEDKIEGKIAWRQLKRKGVKDFSTWKTEKFSDHFTELLNSLKS